MIDIDAEFRKAMGMSGYTSSAETEADKPLTLDILKEAKRKLDALGPPPPQVKLSKHVPALGDAKPSSQPLSDDMRAMCDHIGPQKIPVAWRLKSEFGDMVLISPLNVKEADDDTQKETFGCVAQGNGSG